jgi:hypothetical protein
MGNIQTHSAQEQKESRDRGLKLIETMAGFCIVCILSLAFVGQLSVSGHVSLCIFCIALPMFILNRLDCEPPTPRVLGNAGGMILLLAMFLAIVGLEFLILQVFPVAACTYAAAIILCTVFWRACGTRGRRKDTTKRRV